MVTGDNKKKKTFVQDRTPEDPDQKPKNKSGATRNKHNKTKKAKSNIDEDELSEQPNRNHDSDQPTKYRLKW